MFLSLKLKNVYLTKSKTDAFFFHGRVCIVLANVAILKFAEKNASIIFNLET